MPFFKTEDIFNASNGGLNIILNLYPQAYDCVSQKNKKFKLRDSDKTASVALKEFNDGGITVWKIKDFGNTGTLKNGIDCWMEEKMVDFATACAQLAGIYNVGPQDEPKLTHTAEYSRRPAIADEKPGDKAWTIRVDKDGKMSFTDLEIETLFAKNALAYAGWYSKNKEKRDSAYRKIRSVLDKYHFYPLVDYSIVKDRNVNVFSASENYPIFLIDEGSHQKIYQPLNPEKKYRFMYHGEKPVHFLHGLAQIEAEYARRKKSQMEEGSEDEVMNDHAAAGEDDGEHSAEVSKVKLKLDEVIIMSGGSDAINCALLDYWVIWKNSETEKITLQQYTNLTIKVDKIYQLNDIDVAGKKASHEMAMDFLDLRTLELPEQLKKYKDIRGNDCNDFRDYLKYFDADHFKKLIKIALPYRFWDLKPKYEGRGDKKIRTGFQYEFNNVHGYNFLKKNGFYQIEDAGVKSGLSFIEIDGNIVKRVKHQRIKKFLHDFLTERMMDIDLQNAMYKSPQISESSISNIDITEIDFTDNDRNSQLLFFANCTVLVSGDEIKTFKKGDLERYTWDDDVVEHKFALTPEPFTITKDEVGEYKLVVNHQESEFLNFLIQTSRVHWRDELEELIKSISPAEQVDYKKVNHFNIAGPLLSDEQVQEQKRHLINKIFTIGYLMHRYKDGSKPWAVFAMDNRLNEDGKSYGGSGKSLLFKNALAENLMYKYHYISGRNPKVTDNDFLYDGLTEHHRYILVDDANEFLKFDFFFSEITGSIKVNPKGGTPFTIPFAKAAKFAFTSNFTPRNLDSSTERRLLYTVFSDYFHEKGETTDYSETWTPKDDFGRRPFDDWEEADWNQFYNTLAYCLKFYLSATEKIGPAMGAVTKRNLFAIMGNNFHDWAIAYFSEEGENVNRAIIREHAMKDYKTSHPDKLTPQGWWDKIQAFCKYYGYVFNPLELRGKNNKIMQKVAQYEYDNRTNVYKEISEAKKVTKELLYIKTSHEIPTDIPNEPVFKVFQADNVDDLEDKIF